jgi:hypothetical protein
MKSRVEKSSLRAESECLMIQPDAYRAGPDFNALAGVRVFIGRNILATSVHVGCDRFSTPEISLHCAH